MKPQFHMGTGEWESHCGSLLKKKHVDFLGWTIEKYWDQIFQDPTICVFLV